MATAEQDTEMAETQHSQEELDQGKRVERAERMSPEGKEEEQLGEQKLEGIVQEVVQMMDQVKQEKEEDDSAAVDGQTSGFESPFPPPPSQPSTHSVPAPAVKVEKEKLGEEEDKLEEKEEERGEQRIQEELEEKEESGDEEGFQVQNVNQREEVKEEAEDSDESDGPPPGWGSPFPKPQLPSPPIPQSFPSLSPPGVKVEEEVDDEEQMEGPPPGWDSPQRQLQPPATPPLTQSLVPLSSVERAHVVCKTCHRFLTYPPGSRYVRCSDCRIVNQAVEERAQMICGFCRRLLSYPPGSRFVQCSLCKQVNYVLQEHEVGQVKCGNCTELLMYPYGAPSVRCTKCHFVTDIEEHNRRPPLSVQQGRSPPPTTLAH